MNNLEKILSAFNEAIVKVADQKSLEELRVQFLGKKGFVTEAFAELKNLGNEEKKSFGASINKLREHITKSLEEKKSFFEDEQLNIKLIAEKVDVTESVRKEAVGLIHPISKVIKELRDIFTNFGFEFCEGFEIENDFHNFTALNMPKDHPARQMQDTFYLPDADTLLRTHTSTVQIRKMLEVTKAAQGKELQPLKVAAVGRVFRRDSDQTHTPMFHQMEVLVVDKSANMANLRFVLQEFLQEFFAVSDLSLRFRPSFFPFTEPSAEVDIGYYLRDNQIVIGKNNNSKDEEKFLEILGCGMIHPNVLRNCEIDSDTYQGFAFGVGIERLAMLKYGIRDLRMFFENDVRFLKHYGFRSYEF